MSAILGTCALGPVPNVGRATEYVTRTTRYSVKRRAFAGLLALYLLAATRERILFIFPSE
jgi:hypothetical protein